MEERADREDEVAEEMSEGDLGKVVGGASTRRSRKELGEGEREMPTRPIRYLGPPDRQ